MTSSTPEDEALLTGFEAAALASFHHADHVHVTWTYLGRLPLLDAAQAVTAGLKRFAAANPDLLTWTPSILERFYDRDTLDSPLARGAFLWPERTNRENGNGVMG